ncbi:cytochrome P450 [Patulibacter defluvii]|uniref:cytochrome P450 n=1 Tax=Patulibacter defluvii TaxID=3095358 RepID=UPI002A75B4A5|nr:cytochrome P450 [Patulibacter sp. DM4]
MTAGEPIELPSARSDPLEPPAALAALRERSPVCRLRFADGQVGWLVTGYALGRALLVDARFRVADGVLPLGDHAVLAEIERIEQAMPESAGVLIGLDPPQHTRVRRAAARHFTVRAVRERAAAIERIVAERLDAMVAAGPPADLFTAFALPLASGSICAMLGVPDGDRERFERPSAVLVDPRADAAAKRRALAAFSAYCRQVTAAKRAQPGDDLLSAIVAAGELDEAEIAGLARQLFEAGHETTASMLAVGVFALLRERSRWQALRADPTLVDGAVDELLRYLSIVQLGSFSRTASEDVALGAVTVRAGEKVVVSLPAANRDPERFPDPDLLDLGRDAAGHLAFGHGRHVCIGQHLARLELRIGLRRLLERLPGLALDVPAEQVRFHGGEHLLLGVAALPVRW